MSHSVWGLDVSRYQEGAQTSPAKLAEFHEQGLEFVIVKSSMGGGVDPRCDTHSSNVRAVYGIALGHYHWIDPIHGTKAPGCFKQLDYFEQMVNKHCPLMIFPDYEQWWKDWDKYYKYRRGEIPLSEVPRFDANYLNDHAWMMQEEIDRRFNGLLIMPYTARWFVNAYAPKMLAWLQLRPCWNADYGNRGAITFTKTWAKFHEMLNLLIKPYYVTRLPWTLWQITDKWILPGFNYSWQRMDLNLFNGTAEKFWKMVEDGQLPPPAPVAHEYRVVNCWVLSIRSAPGAITLPAVGHKLRGQTVTGYEFSGNWVRIGDGQWVNGKYLEKI